MTLVYVYLLALFLSGVVLGARLLLGGPEPTATGPLLPGALRSLRFWTFTLAIFGMAGLSLRAFGAFDSPALSLVVAGALGAGSGLGAAALVRRAARG